MLSAPPPGKSFSEWFEETNRAQQSNSGNNPFAPASSDAASGSQLPVLDSAAVVAAATSAFAAYAPSSVHRAFGFRPTDHESDEEKQSLTPSATSNGSSDLSDQFTVTRTERFKYFVALLVVGVFFLLSSLFFLVGAVFGPSKFAFAFTSGSLCIMGAFALLQGPAAWATELMRPERLPFTAAYLGSILGTLVSTLYFQRYLLILGFTGMQISALGWYTATYVPGGKVGMRVISTTVRTVCVGCFKSCRACAGFAMG